MERLLKSRPIFAIKVGVMARMGILPTEERAKKMTDLQWLVLASFIKSIDSSKSKHMSDFWATMLGTSTEGRRIIPLSFFLNPQAASKVFRPPLESEEIKEALSEEATKHLEEVMTIDIDGMLTDEDRARLENMSFEELLEEERMCGVVLGKGKNEGE